MEIVEQRLRRTVRVLEQAGIPYAVVGGNAVRIWVAQIDQGAVRATNDVDILVRPADLAAEARGHPALKASRMVDPFSRPKPLLEKISAQPVDTDLYICTLGPGQFPGFTAIGGGSVMARLVRGDLFDPAEVSAFHCMSRCESDKLPVPILPTTILPDNLILRATALK